MSETSRSRSTAVFGSAQVANDGPFDLQDWARFVGVSLVWGASFLLMAESLEALTPAMVTLGRVSTGAATLWGLRLLSNDRARIAAEDRRKVTLLALLWVAIPFTLFPIAQQWINSAVAGLLNGATPLFVALVSVAFLRIAPTRTQLIGLLVGFFGVVLISLGAAGEGSSEARGVALVLLATLCYGLAFNIAPPLQATYGSVVLMSSVLGIAAVVVTPMALLDLGDNQWQLRPLLAVTTLGAVGTGLAFWIMSALVGRIGSIRASFITYVVPIVSLVLGIAVRGDVVGSVALVGTPVTLAGAFLASRRTR